jgi:hypothetical protein
VHIVGADIGIDLDCSGGKFINPSGSALTADGVKVAGSIYMRYGFSAEGQVSLRSAVVGRVLDGTYGKFLKKHGDTLKADGLQVGADIVLCGGFTSDGKVRLVGANIAGDLEVNHAQFPDGGSLTLERAKVKGGFFSRGYNAELNLTNASTGPIYDDKDCWPKKGNLKLDGFVYTRIAEGPLRRSRGWNGYGNNGPTITMWNSGRNHISNSPRYCARRETALARGECSSPWKTHGVSMGN